MQPGWRMSQGQRGEPCRCDGEVLIHLRELEALEVIHAQVGHAHEQRRRINVNTLASTNHSPTVSNSWVQPWC